LFVGFKYFLLVLDSERSLLSQALVVDAGQNSFPESLFDSNRGIAYEEAELLIILLSLQFFIIVAMICQSDGDVRFDPITTGALPAPQQCSSSEY